MTLYRIGLLICLFSSMELLLSLIFQDEGLATGAGTAMILGGALVILSALFDKSFWKG